MPNQFGKYPLASAVKKYLNATEQYYAPSTQYAMKRRVRYVAEKMVELGAPSNPLKWNESHVKAFIKWTKTAELRNGKIGLDNATQVKYLTILKDFMAFYDNNTWERMKAKREVRMPRVPPKVIKTLPENIITQIHECAKLIDGWPGSVARLFTILYPYSGLRPSELRQQEITDIDTANWVLRVSHPKGENVYGEKRYIPILPHIRPTIALYLQERKEYLKNLGYPEDTIPLIPYLNHKRKITFWPHQKLLLLKAKIEELSGIRFKLKDYRSTFIQMAIDKGAELQAVSKLSGHLTTRTTEIHYGRIRDVHAMQEVERAFMEPRPKI